MWQDRRQLLKLRMGEATSNHDMMRAGGCVAHVSSQANMLSVYHRGRRSDGQIVLINADSRNCLLKR